MSDKKIQLSIFNPLGEYFTIMSNACGGIKIGCSEDKFKSIITNECDVSGNTDITIKNKPSDKFLKALDLFALNLKTFDSPISAITIKGALYKIFIDVFNKKDVFEINPTTYELKLKNVDKLFKDLNSTIDNSNLLGKMKDSINKNPNDTYESNLKKELDKLKLVNITLIEKDKEKEKKTKQKNLIDNVFNSWLFNVFDIYNGNIAKFGIFLDDIKTQWNDSNIKKEFEQTHIEAFNFFFEIIDDKTSLPLVGEKNFWDNLKEALNDTNITKFENLKVNRRINIKVVTYIKDLEKYKKPENNTPNLKAGISFAFPSDIQKKFNDFLIKKSTMEITDIKNNFYEIKDACKKGIFTIDKDKVKEVLKFIKDQGTGRDNNNKYEEDAVDNEKYTDTFVTDDTIDELNDYVKKYKNTWAKDENGNLYTKMNLDTYKISNKTWTAYTEEQVNKDIESFKNGDGHCGNLCLFSNPDKCNDFFKDMTEGKEISFDRLAEMVNENGFKNNYKILKENIVKVNPSFIIGTLKAFKFERWEKLNRDGSKTIKVESFTRWWKTNGENFLNHPTGVDSLQKKIDKDPLSIKLHVNKDKDNKETLSPSPPENLELFLKLLVTFINNNQFVLNPQKKNDILKNRLQTTSLLPASTETEQYLEQMINGVLTQVPNYAWNKKKKENGDDSFGSVYNQMKKNSRNESIESTTETRDILKAFEGLSYGLNPFGRILFSSGILGNSRTFRGGADVNMEDKDDINKVRNTLKPCARTAFEALVLGHTNLKIKNKTIKYENESETDILNEIIQLSDLENKVLEKLKIIANYETVINSLHDVDAQNIGIDEMQKEIADFNDSSRDVSTRADGLTSLISNMFNIPTSKYVRM